MENKWTDILNWFIRVQTKKGATWLTVAAFYAYIEIINYKIDSAERYINRLD